MSTAAREARIAVMMLVEVSWDDAEGRLQRSSARMEDKSLSGACIRLKKPVPVGAKLKVQSRSEQFAGVVKYCRSEGWDYIVGVLRDAQGPGEKPELAQAAALGKRTERSTTQPPVPSLPVSRLEVAGKSAPMKATVDTVAGAGRASGGAGASIRSAEPVTGGENERKSNADRRSQTDRREDFGVHRRTRFRSAQPLRTRELPRERKSMARKWLEMAPWQSKRESPSASGGESGLDSVGERKKENPMQESGVRASRESKDRKAETESGFQIDLMPMEDIYHAAGITNPRKGYSIHKVVEMLNSEHIVGLTKEMKRAAVMVALEAADISLGQVQQDAKARHEALERYEAEQTKLIEAEWARKSEENIRIQEELERVKAQYAERVKRNLDEVAREKALFDRWLSTKQEEVRSISSAVDLCLKREVSEPESARLANAAAAGAGNSTALLPSPTKA